VKSKMLRCERKEGKAFFAFSSKMVTLVSSTTKQVTAEERKYCKVLIKVYKDITFFDNFLPDIMFFIYKKRALGASFRTTGKITRQPRSILQDYCDKLQFVNLHQFHPRNNSVSKRFYETQCGKREEA
jgi:hypothetical protein